MDTRHGAHALMRRMAGCHDQANVTYATFSPNPLAVALEHFQLAETTGLVGGDPGT